MKSTVTKMLASTVWLLIGLMALAYVFTIVGCGHKGDRGNSGLQGLPGSPGLTVVGPVGPAGDPGQNGSDASIGIVPLCPGVSNYGTFVEVALLISGDLYAVYSSNGGFMTYLAPGAYTSNAIGSACNFTVNPDGTVSH